jgi:hypothetical protein
MPRAACRNATGTSQRKLATSRRACCAIVRSARVVPGTVQPKSGFHAVSCLIFLCDSEGPVLAGSRALRSCDAIAHATLNRVQDRSVRTPLPPRVVETVAVLQVWPHEEAVSQVIDAARRLGLTNHFEVIREVILPFAAGPGAIKRMSLLERAAGLTPDKFREVWKETHGPRVASRAGALLGYCQNHVICRSPAAPPCDGLTELWFPDVATMEAVLPPDPSDPEALTAQASAFIGRISTLLLTEVSLK